MKKIAIFIEENNGIVCNVGLELISETRRKVGADVAITAIYLTAVHNEANISKIKRVGPNDIIMSANEVFRDYDTHYYAQTIYEIIKGETYDVFLLGSTIVGRDLAPRLSARLVTGLTADATILDYEVKNEKVTLLATRPALGGNLFATILCPQTRPQMATIRGGVFSVEPYNGIETNVSYHTSRFTKPSKVRIIARKKLVKDAADLTKARIIIAGGRGVATKFSEIKTLATLVNGEAAASRAVIDAGVEAKDRLVGQTGANVAPSVYVAFGISGAIQHVSGMEKSELIIAINNDRDALIFNVADVGLVADAHAVMPLLISKLEADTKSIKRTKNI